MLFLILSLISAVVDWIAVARDDRRTENWAKPAALVLLLAAFLWLAPRPPHALVTLFAIGLAFSLAGDVFLMVPGDRFIAGLIAFLLAHLAYIAAFNLEGPALTVPGLLLLGLAAAAAWLVLSRLTAAMAAGGRRKLIGPVVVYGIVLSLMTWSAVSTLTRATWSPTAGWLAAIGGCLFFFSDTALAWLRFVRPLPGGRTLEMITYHLAQYALSAAVLLKAAAL